MDPIALQAHYLIALSLVTEGKLSEADKKVDFIIKECMSHEGIGVKGILYKAYKLKLDIHVENKPARDNVSAIMLQIFSEDSEYGAKVLYDLAQYHKVTNDQVRYIEALKQLQEKYPDNEYKKDILFELALMQQSQKDVRSAIKSYISYLNLIGKNHPNTAIAAVNLASCYTAINKAEDAKTTLKRYLNITPK